jgi:type II secretory pathway predicted ATPase ExeA
MLLRQRGVMQMYLDYWKLKKHPFNNVPDPEMYFDMHQSVEAAVSELLFAIDEGDECLAVVVGPVGVGKTMCLRIVLSSLDQAKYRIAFITNPDMTYPQLLREIVGQLEGKECTEKRKDRLYEKFNSLLFATSDAGKRVVIFIDEGNAIKPHNLDSLRLLTNMQDDHQNLLTIVLAGQPELAKRLEAPRRENLFQRIGVYCKIEGLNSRETMKDYIEHRLERAGMSGDSMFTEGAYDEVWKLSDGGMPRLINKICKLALKAAETNNVHFVDQQMVKEVGERFRKVLVKMYGADQARAVLPEPVEEAKATVQQAEAARPALRVLTQNEKEKLASQLATEKLKTLVKVLDPFEAWTKARDEFLREIERNTGLRQAAG